MRKADNLPPSCAVVTKSGNLNFLEPSGPVQACNGTALPSSLVLVLVLVLVSCLQALYDAAVYTCYITTDTAQWLHYYHACALICMPHEFLLPGTLEFCHYDSGCRAQW